MIPIFRNFLPGKSFSHSKIRDPEKEKQILGVDDLV